jgi:hypothetical protein
VSALLGLIGLLIWPDTPATTRFERASQMAVRISWPLITLLFTALLIDVYPRAASLGANRQLSGVLTSLAAWLLVSGGVVTQRRTRALLLGLSVVVAVGAALELLAASG